MIDGRKFGVEVECFNITRETLVAKMQAAGFECFDDGYSHSASASWKVVTDNSVQGAGSRTGSTHLGCELVSPVLEGEAGLKVVARVLVLLAKWGARVNHTCGFHVHVDAADLSIGAHRRLCANYVKHEALLDALVPTHRRGQGNSYCRTMNTKGDAAATMRSINKAQSLDDLACAVNPGWSEGNTQQGRYRKLNLCAFWRHGTVEFRQQGGPSEEEAGMGGTAVPAAEWLAWARLCVAMVCSAKRAVTKENAKREGRSYRLQGNLAEFWANFVGDARVANHYRARLEAVEP